MKAFIKTTLCSLGIVALTSGLFTLLGFLLVNLNLITVIKAIVISLVFLLLVMLDGLVGYRLFGKGKYRFLSVVIIPIVCLIISFAASILTFPFLSMFIQYPVFVFCGAFGVRSDSLWLYAVDILFYLLLLTSMFIGGSIRKAREID